MYTCTESTVSAVKKQQVDKLTTAIKPLFFFALRELQPNFQTPTIRIYTILDLGSGEP